MRLRLFVDLVLPPDALNLLSAGTKDHELYLCPMPKSVLDRGEPDQELLTADVAFGQPDPEMIAKASRMKWVHISSSGITRYDTQKFRALARERGFSLSNSAQVYKEPCALHALSFLLSQARELPLALSTQTAGGSSTWNALREASTLLAEQTLVIVGYGAIGTRLAELVRPLGMRVLAYRRRPRGDETVPVLSAAELDGALSDADYVMNILPLSGETEGFFGQRRFSSLKRGAVFCNIGRGATVDQKALLDSLRRKRLKAAWLDVTDPEPLPADHPLLAEPACHITPHVAGGHTGEASSLVRHFLENLRRFVEGEPLVDRVM